MSIYGEERSWGPTPAGELIMSGTWKLTLKGSSFCLSERGTERWDSVLNITQCNYESGVIWSSVVIESRLILRTEVDGMDFFAATQMVRALTEAKALETAEQKAKREKEKKELVNAHEPLLAWVQNTLSLCREQLQRRGWLTNEFKRSQDALRPASLTALLNRAEVINQVTEQPEKIQTAVKFWSQNFDEFCLKETHRHVEAEKLVNKEFFARVEKSPLSDEQVDAVVCFENRVLLVASAGSGKTSTMVAKTGYALHKGYFAADKILLLAFNNDAAAELRARLAERLIPLGLPIEKVTAKTFHAFGLDVIGKATGARPSLAPWVESGQDLEALLRLVDELKDEEPEFRAAWDLFRIVLGQDLPEFGAEDQFPDAWDATTKKDGFRTFNNEVVKSRGEQLLANWLFYNGVNYVYEEPYEHKTANESFRQYRPDFYFPDIGVYLEHWALDENGNPPPSFTNYKDGVEWKRKLHAQHRTPLLETTMATLWSGDAFSYLAASLEKFGVVLDPNPDREADGQKPIQAPRMARTFRTFLSHMKGNRLTIGEVRRKLKAGVAGHFSYRHKLFLDLFERIAEKWDEQLAAEGCIDFEDMLGMAASHIESGKWSNPYELVLVDEFQDASQARTRILKGMCTKPGSCLFAVGDDWQSINRFAGADISVMTDFNLQLGPGITLKLEQTFRCPQSLCDISSKFVQKNPRQIQKRVRSTKPDVKDPVRIIRLKDARQETQGAVQTLLAELAQAQRGEPLSVFLLGRYNNDRSYMPHGFDRSKLNIQFVTAHSSKGLEADHIVIPGLTSLTLGFPSTVSDDPVLQLAMPKPDEYSNAEERRLFYVALTRAKLSVTLITQLGRESAFINELVKDHGLSFTDANGAISNAITCPVCRQGFMIPRNGRNGEFLGCSGFPQCKYTMNCDTSVCAAQGKAVS